MNDTYILSVTTFVYFFAAFFYLSSLFFHKRFVERVALIFVCSGCALHTVAIGIRWIISYHLGIGHAPLSNFYESLVFFSWAIIFVFLLMIRRYKQPTIGMFASFFAFLLLAYASLSGQVAHEIQPLIPALQSNWLISHVISSFLAYACFTISFGASVVTLTRLIGRISTDTDFWEDVTYRMISMGFVLLTLGIITGAAWADRAWGRYWGWDPKETWSLITWLIYGTFLHARLIGKWRGLRMSLISILGFLAVMFTYLGVNYILSGMHSYL
ncbi:MAG TPA: cytochrome c biogenesis protein CcsA [Syntrophales bacterium]|nr:cytochrome c biogenesis protein CcsA [Syntrophales bacterium]